MSESEVIETRGQFRAVIHLDPESSGMKPDGDFFGYVFSMERGRFDLEAKAHSAPAEDFGLESAWERWGDLDMVERYLRMFWDVVGVDSFDTRDAKYVNIVTRKDLEIWGWPEDPEAWPKNDDGTTREPTQGNLDEFRAWVDGDVWYWTIEKRVHWTTRDLEPDNDNNERDTWEEVDSCHGYYGDEYARQRALEELEEYAPKEESEDAS